MKNSGFKKKRNEENYHEKAEQTKKKRQREIDDAEADREIREYLKNLRSNNDVLE